MTATTDTQVKRNTSHSEAAILLSSLAGFQLTIDAMLTGAIQEASLRLNYRKPDTEVLTMLGGAHKSRAKLAEALEFWKTWIVSDFSAWDGRRQELEDADPSIPETHMKAAFEQIEKILPDAFDEVFAAVLNEVTPWFVYLKGLLLASYDEYVQDEKQQ